MTCPSTTPRFAWSDLLGSSLTIEMRPASLSVQRLETGDDVGTPVVLRLPERGRFPQGLGDAQVWSLAQQQLDNLAPPVAGGEDQRVLEHVALIERGAARPDALAAARATGIEA